MREIVQVVLDEGDIIDMLKIKEMTDDVALKKKLDSSKCKLGIIIQSREISSGHTYKILLDNYELLSLYPKHIKQELIPIELCVDTVDFKGIFKKVERRKGK